MNPVLQTIIDAGSAHGTPMQRAIFGFLPNATNFYLDGIEIEGAGQYIYTLNGERHVVDLEDNYSGSIWVAASDAGSKLIVRGEAIISISQNEQQMLTSLDVSGLTDLIVLDCGFNLLTSLDVSGLTALTTLYCGFNPLTSLDVSGLTALTTLYCAFNSLTSLDVSGLTALDTLQCNNNLLTSLDVSGLTTLTTLTCYNNSLTSLDVSGLTALTTLYCGFNSLITSVKFNATKQSPASEVANLITAADSTTGVVWLNNSDAYYSTVATAATAKGWTINQL